MRKRRMLCLLFALALALSLLAGCGAAPETAQSQGGDTAADDGHYPVTVTNYDREVTVESRPEAVLTLGPNCTELFVALGLGDLVVGRSLVNHSRGPLDEYADEVNAIPELNHSSATRERILSSGADFIYTLDWEIGEEGVVIDEVEEYGMNVYVNAAKTLEDQYKEIEDIGKIFNVEDAAAKFIQEQKDRISAVQDKVKGEEPVKVLIYDSGNDGVFDSCVVIVHDIGACKAVVAIEIHRPFQSMFISPAKATTCIVWKTAVIVACQYLLTLVFGYGVRDQRPVS